MANVLIVDDQAEIVELSSELLESAGHRVRSGNNGEEGLMALDAGPLPDCVLLDVDMPVLSGPEMAHQMLLHDAGEEQIPIILVSGREDLAEIARSIGAPYFVVKGTDHYGKQLLAKLELALREQHAPRAARSGRYAHLAARGHEQGLVARVELQDRERTRRRSCPDLSDRASAPRDK